MEINSHIHNQCWASKGVNMLVPFLTTVRSIHSNSIDFNCSKGCDSVTRDANSRGTPLRPCPSSHAENWRRNWSRSNRIGSVSRLDLRSRPQSVSRSLIAVELMSALWLWLSKVLSPVLVLVVVLVLELVLAWGLSSGLQCEELSDDIAGGGRVIDAALDAGLLDAAPTSCWREDCTGRRISRQGSRFKSSSGSGLCSDAMCCESCGASVVLVPVCLG